MTSSVIAAAAESERQPEAGLRLSDRDPLALLGFGGIWKTEDSDASEGFCHPGPASPRVSESRVILVVTVRLGSHLQNLPVNPLTGITEPGQPGSESESESQSDWH